MPSNTRRSKKRRNLKRRSSTTSQREFATMLREFERPSFISEGDSWFDYPSKFGSKKPANIIDHIQRRTRGKVSLLRMESNGDEVTGMMSGKQRHTITKLLHRYAEKGTPISVLFYSGGGNDVVGEWDMERFLRPYRSGATAAQCLNQVQVKNKLRQIELAYLELIDIRNQYSPGTAIVGHTYDIPFITGIPAKYLIFRSGPWITPAMETRGIPQRLRRPVIRLLFEQLRSKLLSLQDKSVSRGTVRIADTVEILHQKDQWLNEIHPTSEGFELIAERVYAEVRTILPDLPDWQ